MHFPDKPAVSPAVPPTPADGPWWRTLNRYQWFVLMAASLGWLFDTMDQQLFNIARRPAMRALVAESDVTAYSGYATTIFLVGWGTGGIIFGIVADLFGRARSMVFTILLYSLFTGLSALSVGFWDFAFYRFLTGLGVGGQFAVGVSLVAEEMPDRARPFALGLLQALSAVGNITAALTGIVLAYLARDGVIRESWRVMFLIGTVPALLVLFIMRRLREPERWRKLAAESSVRQRLGAYWSELFRDPRWSRNAVVGLLLASSGIIGLWAIGFFSIDLQRAIFRVRLEAEGLPADQVTFREDLWASVTSVTLNVGAFFGIYAFSWITHFWGRRPTFAVAFVLALASTAFVFWNFNTIGDIFWMIPIMGFCQLALFGGYAIYFPELFPTRLRSTGTSFCYNGARFVAALGPSVLGQLHRHFVEAEGMDKIHAFRLAGVIMCAIFLVGLFVLPFAPETRGKPLPE
ncbi:MAG TPA: MFS transporter [Gemmataceae bacterium]|jgi:MFS family permease|nr:MFS transporter [Gemmataceae bacterium]